MTVSDTNCIRRSLRMTLPLSGCLVRKEVGPGIRVARSCTFLWKATAKLHTTLQKDMGDEYSKLPISQPFHRQGPNPSGIHRLLAMLGSYFFVLCAYHTLGKINKCHNKIFTKPKHISEIRIWNSKVNDSKLKDLTRQRLFMNFQTEKPQRNSNMLLC